MNLFTELKDFVLPFLSGLVTWFASRWWVKRQMKRSKDSEICESLEKMFSEDQLRFLREWDHGAVFHKKYAYNIHDLAENLYQNHPLTMIHNQILKAQYTHLVELLQNYSVRLSLLTSPSSNPDYLTMDVTGFEVRAGKMAEVKLLNNLANQVYKAYIDLTQYCKKELYL